MKKIILLCCLLTSLCACERLAQWEYERAQALQKNKQYAQAIEKYQHVLYQYSQTEVAKKIPAVIEQAEKDKLAYYISENKPKVIAAVRNYPFPRVFTGEIRERITWVAKQWGIPLDALPSVDKEMKMAAIGVCVMLPQYLAYSCLEAEKKKFIWNASSSDNKHWTVTMKSYPNEALDPNSKPHTSILKVNLEQQTLSLQTREHCGAFAPNLEKRISNQKKGRINWGQECVIPLKIEGILQ